MIRVVLEGVVLCRMERGVRNYSSDWPLLLHVDQDCDWVLARLSTPVCIVVLMCLRVSRDTVGVLVLALNIIRVNKSGLCGDWLGL